MRDFGIARTALITVVWLGVATMIAPVFAHQEKPAQSASGTAASPGSAAASESATAGPEACKTCHEEIYSSWEKSPHWKTTLNTREGPTHQGCAGCHGETAAHLADPSDTSKLFKFEKATAKEIDERCLTCHAGGTQHMNAINSLHAKNDVSCTSCHSPHHGKETNFLLVKSQPELCYSCHLQQKPQFAMPFHHRVNEGLVQCTDCHNPHGTVRGSQLRSSATQDMVCMKCHVDKQGPFVFEHEVVKVEGCQSCHTPHGSPNPKMLKLSNVNLLCLQCHTASFANAPGAPSFHNQSTQFQACTLCHTQIHGSNFDSFFFK